MWGGGGEWAESRAGESRASESMAAESRAAESRASESRAGSAEQEIARGLEEVECVPSHAS